MALPLLSTVLLAPLVAALTICLLPREARREIRLIAAGTMTLATVLTLYA